MRWGRRYEDERPAMRNVKYLRWWAIVALVLIGAVYVAPRSTLTMLIERPESNMLIKTAVAGLLLVVILEFFLRMFFECAFSRNVFRRGAWLLVLICVPIFSAFVYFFVTRSTRYLEYVHRANQQRAN